MKPDTTSSASHRDHAGHSRGPIWGGIMLTAAFATLSVGIGFGLGAAPLVQDYLHWNLWFVLPISGFIFGAGLAWLQFKASYALGRRVSTRVAIFFCTAIVIAYFATEIGTYSTLRVSISGVEGTPDGEYRIASLCSFDEYLLNRLGSSTISLAGRHGSFDLGATGTSISFIADLLGAAAGAAASFLCLIPLYPFCADCACFKRRYQLHKIQLHPDQMPLDQALASINEACQMRDYRGLVRVFDSLESVPGTKSPFQILADERLCPRCSEITVVGRVRKRQGNEWKELDELAFGTSFGKSAAIAREAE